jgi:hypothetical protein
MDDNKFIMVSDYNGGDPMLINTDTITRIRPAKREESAFIEYVDGTSSFTAESFEEVQTMLYQASKEYRNDLHRLMVKAILSVREATGYEHR